MTKAMMIVLGAVVGFAEGMVFFVIVNFSFEAPLGAFASGEWLTYSSLLFGGIGALSGGVLGWAVLACMKKARVYVSVPRRAAKAGDPPYRGPFG